MRVVTGILSTILFSCIFFLWLNGQELVSHIVHGSNKPEATIDSKDRIKPLNELAQNKQYDREKETKIEPTQAELISVFIGMTEQELEELMGKPKRVDPTLYGYDWWIYHQEWSDHIQVGICDGRVVTYYTNSPLRGWEYVSPGMSKDKWLELVNIKSEVSFIHQLGFYTFMLTKEELKERPLIFEDKVAIQLYIDVHDEDRISGIRVMDVETLLLQRPYALRYSGELPEPPTISREEEEEIARANEQQIFELVNISRRQHDLPVLNWSEHVANVARGHSADMLLNNYFDHYSQEYGDLVERLNLEEIAYSAAGENIAWNYMDAPDAHEGWLNSMGHRKNVFKKEFTHLGVGVVEKYYTQNFIKELN